MMIGRKRAMILRQTNILSSCFLVQLLYVTLLYGAWDFGREFASEGYSSGGAAYLCVPVYAQNASLGGATTAWDENLAGWQYNPAILDALDDKAIALMATRNFASLGRNFTGVDGALSALDFSVLGLSFMHQGDPSIEGRDENGFVTETFGSSANSLAATAAGRIRGSISVGGRIRYLLEKIEREYANGIGCDLGALWHPTPTLNIGIGALNLLSYMWWSTGQTDAVQPAARLGVNVSFLRKSLMTEVDFVKTLSQPVEGIMGLQYTILDLISIRGGAQSAIDISDKQLQWPDFSFGTGIHYAGIGFDYSCTIPSSELGLTHRISITATLRDLW